MAKETASSARWGDAQGRETGTTQCLFGACGGQSQSVWKRFAKNPVQSEFLTELVPSAFLKRPVATRCCSLGRFMFPEGAGPEALFLKEPVPNGFLKGPVASEVLKESVPRRCS